LTHCKAIVLVLSAELSECNNTSTGTSGTGPAGPEVSDREVQAQVSGITKKFAAQGRVMQLIQNTEITEHRTASEFKEAALALKRARAAV
jgi:hypothetical protein